MTTPKPNIYMDAERAAFEECVAAVTGYSIEQVKSQRNGLYEYGQETLTGLWNGWCWRAAKAELERAK